MWIRAETDTLIAGDYAELAQELGIRETSTEGIVLRIKGWLASQTPAVLVFFHRSKSEELIRRFLPDAGPCLACLLTHFEKLSPAPELYADLRDHALRQLPTWIALQPRGVRPWLIVRAEMDAGGLIQSGLFHN